MMNFVEDALKWTKETKKNLGELVTDIHRDRATEIALGWALLCVLAAGALGFESKVHANQQTQNTPSAQRR